MDESGRTAEGVCGLPGGNGVVEGEWRKVFWEWRGNGVVEGEWRKVVCEWRVSGDSTPVWRSLDGQLTVFAGCPVGMA